MVVNYNAKTLHKIGPLNTVVIYNGILTLEYVDTAINYIGIFITLAPKANVISLLLMYFTAIQW
jgi:hypothetical protein